jgi:hypothetical protein
MRSKNEIFFFFFQGDKIHSSYDPYITVADRSFRTLVFRCPYVWSPAFHLFVYFILFYYFFPHLSFHSHYTAQFCDSYSVVLNLDIVRDIPLNKIDRHDVRSLPIYSPLFVFY